MKRSRLAPLIVIAVLVAGAALFAAVSAKPAAAYPNYDNCSGCHTLAPSGPVSAVPSTTTPAAGAAYTVDITNGLTASGHTGYHVESNDAGTPPVTTVFGGGSSSTATTFQANMTAPPAAGTYTYKVWLVKGGGSAGMATSVTYSITVGGTPAPDTTAPTTVASGAVDNGWYNHDVPVTLTATDNAGGSGVDTIVYSLDGGADQTVTGSSTVVNVPSGTNGPHTIAYHAVDKATNAEATKTLHVNIDTVAPTVSGSAAVTMKHGKTGLVKCQVNDAAPNGGTAKITISVKAKNGKKVKFNVGAKSVNMAVKYTLKSAKLVKGKYTYTITAMDTAGNASAPVSYPLTVK